MSGSATTSPDAPTTPAEPHRRTPAEQWAWQAADSQGAHQQLEILDEVRTSNMIFRGQKQLQQLVDLKNRLLFGKEAVDAVAIPEDNIKINCPEIYNNYPPKPGEGTGTPPTTPVSPDIAKVAKPLISLATAFALGGPIGLGLASIPVISNWLKPPAVAKPAESKPDTPTVNIGGNDYQLGLGKPD